MLESFAVLVSCSREYANSKKKKNKKKQVADGADTAQSADTAKSIEIGSALMSEAFTTVDLVPKQPYRIGDGPTLSLEQEDLVSRAIEGHNIFYTGSAGCGKSTVLREIRRRLMRMDKNVHVLAPTGKVAMANGGKTTWSFAGWTPNTHKFSLSELKEFSTGRILLERFRNADTIILDEVSMVEAMHFNRLNEIMKAAHSPFDERSTLPFGGTQIIVTGDFCQLPPVKLFSHCFECGSDLVPNRRQDIYTCPSTECGASYHDDDKWAFRSKAWDECNFEHVYLEEVHRQKDPEFVKLLQKCRLGLGMNDSELDLLANCNKTTASYAVRLFPTKDEVRKVNDTEFRRIKAPVQTYKCVDVFLWNTKAHPHLSGKGVRNTDDSLKELKDHAFEIELNLKEGMQVLLLHNIDISSGLVNGAQGVIIGFKPFEDELPLFEIRNEGLPVYWPAYDVDEEKILEFMMGCTTSIVPQARATPKDLYAAILETEMPTWLAESHLASSHSPHEKFYTGSADDTLYAMWIGVNDIGKKNIFIDSQTPGTSLTTFTNCIFTAFDRIYKNGGRKFVLMNVPPLELHPIYATPENKGVPPGTPDWPNKPSNLTEVSFKMYEYTSAVNEIFKFQVPFQQHVAKRYPGAKWAIYGEHGLVLSL
ncbi:PIF1-like helicase domain-containing protein [Trichoderma sp. SZMC 28015]